MKIAVASEGKYVSGHFGHCEGFTIYEVEDSKVLAKEFVKNPGHKPGFLPIFLKEHGTNVIIAGGMGKTAQDLFNKNEIEVFVGIEGLGDDAIKELIEGKLKSNESVCTEHHHQHEGHCNE
jgi:predicted Fe-Mo cluster-binding NifX family protein